MRGKPAGSLVTLTVAWGEPPVEGDYLVTRGGSGYLVLRARGKRLECVKVEPLEIPADERVIEWEWVPRR